MRLRNPSLILTFMGGDLPSGHSTTQTVGYEYIINRSVTINEQLLNGLKSASNQITLHIARDCASVEDIIATDGDIKATLKDGATTLFTGFISTNFSWKVTTHGEQALAITLEDTSVRLLAKPFIETGYHLFDCSVSAAAEAICEAAGITISSSAVTINDSVFKVVDASQTCRDILDQMLYEAGYVYYCDNLGEMRFFKIDCTSTSGAPIIDKTKLYYQNGQAVSLTKKIRQYRSVRLAYKEIGTAENYLVYRNTTEADEEHPFCNLPLKAGEHFDGLEIYTAEEWAEETADQFREDALVEACNAASETDIVGSNKIIAVSNVAAAVQKSSQIAASITGAGGPYLKIDCNNSGLDGSITRLDAYASIVFEKSANIVRAGVEGTLTDALLSEEVEYIHSKEQAARHANLLCQFHAYCNSQYTFYSSEAIELGSIVKLNEDVFSGLNVAVMVIGKKESASSDVVTYLAIGISVFDLNKKVYRRATDTGNSNSKGQRGTEWNDGDALTGTGKARGFAGEVGDFYLNNETGDVYRCISSGSAATAVWEWVLNIKGRDADITSQTYSVEYGLSTSDEEFIFPSAEYGYDDDKTYGYEEDKSYGFKNYIWGDDYSGWYHGLFVWQRIKITDAAGNVTYEEPTYAKNLTQSLESSCVIEISALPSSYTSNLRRTDNQYLFLRLKDIGYKGTLTLHTDTGVFASYDENTGLWIDFANAMTITLNGTSELANYGVKLPYALESNVTVIGEFAEWTLAEFDIQSLSICPSIEKVSALQMITVDCYDSLIAMGNIANRTDLVNNYLIEGDYILVRFTTLTATSADMATDENGDIKQRTDFSSYYSRTDNGDGTYTWTPTTVNSFTAGQTYYAFDIAIWMYDGTQWVKNATSAMEVSTVKEAVNLAGVQYETDSTIDFHKCLYAYRIYVDEITAALLKVGNVLANDIESNNYQEDLNGNPVSGYKLEHQQGVTKAVNAKFVNADITGETRIGEKALVQGVIQNTDNNGEMAFETVKDKGQSATYTAGKVDGVDAPTAYSKDEWLSHLTLFVNTNLTDKTVYAVDNCYLKDADNNTVSSLDGIVRFASVSGASTTTVISGVGAAEETKRLWTNQYPCEITLSTISVNEKMSRLASYVMRSGYKVVVYYSNGTVKSTLFNVNASASVSQQSEQARSSSASNVIVPPNGYVNVIWNRYLGIQEVAELGKAAVTYSESANFSVGIYVFKNDSKYLLSSFLGSTGFATLDGTTITIHGFNAITINFLAAASWPLGMYKYYTFTWTAAPANNAEILTSLLEDTSAFSYAGNSVSIGYVRYSATTLSIASTDGAVYVLTGTYIREHTIRLDVKANVIGVRAQNVMPVYKEGTRVGDGTVGSAQEPFHQIFSDLVNGIVVGTSTRDKKTNIKNFKGKALDILLSVVVKQFNFKFEIGTERCYTHYGFIAEDTREELATPYHDVMEEQSCIGILIKAVQELHAEIEKLKGGK